MTRFLLNLADLTSLAVGILGVIAGSTALILGATGALICITFAKGDDK